MTLPNVLVVRSWRWGGEARVVREQWEREEAFQAEGGTDANVTKYGKVCFARELYGSSIELEMELKI